MPLPRVVLPETLDALAEDDPRAIRSRRDLRRVNRVMGTRAIMLRGLADVVAPRARGTALRVLEPGAGDGSLMLALAEKLSVSWPAVELTLLDRQRLVSAETLSGFARLGWKAKSLNVDMLDWIATPALQRWDVIATNLFLHHFDDRRLPDVLRGIGERCDYFFACEPRRTRLPLIASHLIGAIGANAVTREDAVLSVHAGFRGDELATLWPRDTGDWRLAEYSAGLFSHCLRAVRSGPMKAE